MDNQASQPMSAMHQAPATEKKAYHTPTLKTFGHISEVTKTNSSGSGNDGGGYPSSYAS